MKMKKVTSIGNKLINQKLNNMASLKQVNINHYGGYKELKNIQALEDFLYYKALEYSKLGSSITELGIKRQLANEIDNNLRTMEYETTRMLNLTKPVFTFVREN